MLKKKRTNIMNEEIFKTETLRNVVPYIYICTSISM